MTKQDNQARAEREAISEARASVFNQPFRIGTGKPILRVPRPNAPIPQSKPTPATPSRAAGSSKAASGSTLRKAVPTNLGNVLKAAVRGAK